MNKLEDFVRVFNQKLEQTQSLDSAFKKALWIAYTSGFLEGIQDQRVDKTKLIKESKQILKDLE